MTGEESQTLDGLFEEMVEKEKEDLTHYWKKMKEDIDWLMSQIAGLGQVVADAYGRHRSFKQEMYLDSENPNSTGFCLVYNPLGGPPIRLKIQIKVPYKLTRFFEYEPGLSPPVNNSEEIRKYIEEKVRATFEKSLKDAGVDYKGKAIGITVAYTYGMKIKTEYI